MADEPPTHQPFLATALPEAADRRRSVAVIVVSVVTLAVLAPFAAAPLPRSAAFIPSYEAALIIIDLLTGVLLISQFTILRRWSLLVLASAYLLSSVVITAHALSFPGVFAQVGLFGDKQTTGWLYTFWHLSFPLLIAVYARIADSRHDALDPQLPTGRACLGAFVLVALVATALITVSAYAADLLPVLVVDGDFSRMVTTGVSPTIVLICFVAIGLLWRRRLRSVLDVWLFTVLWVWICDVTLSAIVSSARFHLGWYGGRLFGLFAASVLLIAFLFELDRLYARLALAVSDAEARNAELIRSRGELVRAQRLEALGQLTGGIAHDFNNLLAAIRGNLEMIVRRPEDTERVTRLAGNAMKSSDRGAQLIRRLMSIARKQDLHPEAVDTKVALDEFATLAAGLVRPVDRLVFELDDHGTIVVDAADFQSALLNLVTNARDAMADGGTITIHTRRVVADAAGERRIEIAVSDQGSGMTADVQARIFEPFFTTKSLGLGTGLGLSQVHGFAHGAGGSIAVNSVVGVGTTLRLVLPLSTAVPVARPPVAMPPAAVRESPAQRPIGILVVDDDHDVLIATRDQVADLGYTVVTATSGDEAFDLLAGGAPVDLVFSDIMMPGRLDGVQLASAIRSLRPELKWLLTSGFTGGALDRVERSQDYQFLAKPYSRRDLAEKLVAIAGTARVDVAGGDR